MSNPGQETEESGRDHQEMPSVFRTENDKKEVSSESTSSMQTDNDYDEESEDSVQEGADDSEK